MHVCPTACNVCIHAARWAPAGSHLGASRRPAPQQGHPPPLRMSSPCPPPALQMALPPASSLQHRIQLVLPGASRRLGAQMRQGAGLTCADYITRTHHAHHAHTTRIVSHAALCASQQHVAHHVVSQKAAILENKYRNLNTFGNQRPWCASPSEA